MKQFLEFLARFIDPEQLFDIALDEIFRRVKDKKAVIEKIDGWMAKIEVELNERK